MRTCGECTLCCKIPAIEGLKATNTWCKHVCAGGCSIYPERPKVCREFECWWLTHPEMPDNMRPDKVDFYVVGKDEDSLLRVMVNDVHPTAWLGRLEALRKKYHLLVSCGYKLTFVPSRVGAVPAKLVVDWVL